MCGICGVIDYAADGSFGENAIKRMCDEMRHRGPDDEGVYMKKGHPSAVLGHRRLSIIDLSPAGRQPMSNEDGTVWVVLNGEIYNYRALKRSLEKRHRFGSRTDTEVIVHLYEECGEECVKHMRGMFAFAVWDERENKLLLARDRAGKKPLLYHHGWDKFCFASEFAALLAGGLVEKKARRRSIDEYLTYGYVPAPLTVYEDVFKLPPAHMLVLKDNGIVIKPYWELDYGRKIEIPEQEAAKEVLKLLEESVRIRLRSDVPLGAFLSGGTDSSTVTALMSGLSCGRVKTFSIGFEDQDYSELIHARRIAERFDTDHHEFIVKPDALEILPLLVERYGEPYADSSCIPAYYVSRQTRKHVTVALNGDGGDESFAGYERYRAMKAAETIQRLPSRMKKAIAGLAKLLPDSADPKNKLRRIKRFIDGASLPGGKRYVRWVGIFGDDLKKELYSEEFANEISSGGEEAYIGPFLEKNGGIGMLDSLLDADVHSYLPNDLLVKMDIASMANSLEARSPFLDHKLMEFTARLPAEYKLKGYVGKYILKKAVKDLLPGENIHRRKMGFGVPVGKWFRGELKGFVKETLLSPPAPGRGHFKPGVVKSMVDDHIDARKDYTFQLWALLMLELWYRKFID